MLTWVFGPVQKNQVHIHTHDRAAGYLELEKARVRWFLSINSDTLPDAVKAKGGRTFRSLLMEGEEIEFSDGFTELHTQSYQHILDGNGFGLEEAMSSIQLVHDIRHMKPLGLVGDYHPFAKLELSKHPFDV
jgi:UDP-N-acetyl-2-amino-2-deoxyglucuronate dehydrogenase